MTIGRIAALAASCALSLLAAALAGAAGAAAGGPSVAAAPLLSSGREQVNAVAGVDYWRVKLRERDRLTIEYGPQKANEWVEVCVYRPGVSDSALVSARCYAGDQNTSDDALTLTARWGGVWTIAVRPYPGCSSSGLSDPRCTNAGVAYRLTATVRRPTETTLRGPNLVRRGELMRLSGALRGARGRVLLEISLDRGAWQTLSIAPVDGAGRFSASARVARAASVRVRASFPESSQYTASSSTVVIRVV
jgi:hypothetical protein